MSAADCAERQPIGTYQLSNISLSPGAIFLSILELKQIEIVRAYHASFQVIAARPEAGTGRDYWQVGW